MMKSSIKGALLSGLIFPGLGHIVLKYYARGVFLIFTVFACMMVFVIKAVQYAFAILEKIELEGGVLDIKSITEAARQAASTSDNAMFNIALSLIVITWIFGIVDAYRIGKKMDLEDDASGLDTKQL